MSKKVIPSFGGFIDNGKLELHEQAKYDYYIKTLKGEVEIVVKERKKKRSLNQNNLYWAYLTIIEEETGQDAESMHELFKEAFIPAERLSMFGLEGKKYKTTTQLSPMEFSDYIRNIEIKTEILCPKPEDIAQ